MLIEIDRPEYIKLVKSKLIYVLDKKYTYPKNKNGYYTNLQKILEKEVRLELVISTIKNTLDMEYTKGLDIFTVYAICKYCNQDINSILDYDVKNINNTNFITENATIFDDSSYFGEYYGYTISTKTTSNDLEFFKLIIKEENSLPTATLCLCVDNKDFTPKFKMTSTPLFTDNKQNVYICFSDNLGHLYIFLFKYLKFSTLSLYFRKGLFLTQARDTKEPSVQSFVLFDAPIREDAFDYVKGMLSLHSDTFSVTQKSFDNIKNNSYIKYLTENCSNLYTSDLGIYTFNDSYILSSANQQKLDIDIIIKALLLIKNYSIEPTKIIINSNQYLADFSKKIK